MKCDYRMKGYVWTGSCLIILLMVKAIRYSGLDSWGNGQSRPIKLQPKLRIHDVTLNQTEGQERHSESTAQRKEIEVKMDIRENLFYPMINLSTFLQMDDPTEAECQSMVDDVMVAPAYSMPLTALASFPRSGNSWTRSLIQVATKYSTGSVYWKVEGAVEHIRSRFQAGEEDFMLQKGICVKTHGFQVDHISIFNNGGILLIRNPYYSVVSEYFRFFSGVKNISRKTLVDSMETKDAHWNRILLPQFEKWKSLNINWMINSKRVLVVFFEDLEKHTVRELARMVAFLGQPILPRRILCAVQNFKSLEKHRSQMEFDPYTPEMHATLDGYIKEVNKTLMSRNGNPLPTYERYF